MNILRMDGQGTSNHLVFKIIKLIKKNPIAPLPILSIDLRGQSFSISSFSNIIPHTLF